MYVIVHIRCVYNYLNACYPLYLHTGIDTVVTRTLPSNTMFKQINNLHILPVQCWDLQIISRVPVVYHVYLHSFNGPLKVLVHSTLNSINVHTVIRKIHDFVSVLTNKIKLHWHTRSNHRPHTTYHSVEFMTGGGLTKLHSKALASKYIICLWLNAKGKWLKL